MSVSAFYEAQQAATVNYKRGGTKTYSAPWIAVVTSAKDDGDTIVAYLDALGRGINSYFYYGDRIDTSVLCDSITPTREANSTTHWRVTMNYSPPDPSEPGQDPDGNPADDPLDWAYEIDMSSATFDTPVYAAWNVDPFPYLGTGLGYSRPVNTLGPVVNSAGVVIDPPLMRPQTETVIRIAGNLPYYDQEAIDGFVNHINADSILWHDDLIEYYGMIEAFFNSHTVLCSSANARFMRRSGFRFWNYSYEFRTRGPASAINPQDGWYETILDRGITRAAGPGDPDGEGSTYSQGDMTAGRARHAPVLGTDERRIPEVVLFDGHGQPLTDATLLKTGIYFRWRIHPVADLRSIPLKIFK